MDMQVTEDNRFARCRQAADRNMPLAILRQFACDNDEAVRATLLGNAAFAPCVEKLAQAELRSGNISWVMRQAIAHCEYVSADTLRQLSAGNELYVQLGLVNNRSCPVDILERFFRDAKYKEYDDKAGDLLRPTELHHAHLERVYKAIYEIAKKRLDERVSPH